MSGRERASDFGEEIECLRSIFWGEGELVVLGNDGVVLKEGDVHLFALNNLSGTIRISVQLKHEVEGVGTLCTGVELSLSSPSYLTESIPEIKLNNAMLSSNFLEQLRNNATLVAVPGYPCLYDMVQSVKEGLSHVTPPDLACEHVGKGSSTHQDRCWQATKVSERQEEEDRGKRTETASLPEVGVVTPAVSRTLLLVCRLDHMRNSSRYVKVLSSWARELSLCGKVVDKGRGSVYVVVVGGEKGVSELLRRWKTEKVDVDSRGRPCKERLLEVIHRGPLLVSAGSLNQSLLAGCKSSCMVYMDGKGTKISEHFRKDPQVAQVLETLQL